MATKTFDELKQLAIQIRDEKTNKHNTATRVGTEMLEHLNKLEQDYYDKTTINNRTSEYNVSLNHPTSGLSGSNKYDLSSAIAQVPAELRIDGLTVSFLNESGDTEKWEFSGGSWAIGGFSQVGAKKIDKLNYLTKVYSYNKLDKNSVHDGFSLNNSGEEISMENRSTTEMILLNGNKVIRFSVLNEVSDAYIKTAFFDKYGIYISTVEGNRIDSLPENAYFFKATMPYSLSKYKDESWIYLDDLEQNYIPYGYTRSDAIIENPDWSETDTAKQSYIKNKPNVATKSDLAIYDSIIFEQLENPAPVQNKRFSPTTGNLLNNVGENFAAVGPVKVKSNKIHFKGTTWNQYGACWAFDAEGNPLEKFAYVESQQANKWDEDITLPEETESIGLSLYDGNHEFLYELYYTEKIEKDIEQEQSDWDETNEGKPSFIKNKPTITTIYMPYENEKLCSVGDSLVYLAKWQQELIKLTKMTWDSNENGQGVGYVQVKGSGTKYLTNDETLTKGDDGFWYDSSQNKYRKAYPTAVGGTKIMPIAENSIYKRCFDVVFYNPGIIILWGGQNDYAGVRSTAKSNGGVFKENDIYYNLWNEEDDEEIYEGEQNSIVGFSTETGISDVTFRAAYRGILKRLVTDNPTARIICLSMQKQILATSVDTNIFSTFQDDIKGKMNQVIQEAASLFGCQYIDIYNNAGGRQYKWKELYTDGVHQTDLLGKRTAQYIFSQL